MEIRFAEDCESRGDNKRTFQNRGEILSFMMAEGVIGVRWLNANADGKNRSRSDDHVDDALKRIR